MVKQVKNDPGNREHLGRQELELTPDGLIHTLPNSQSKVGWRLVEGIDSTEMYTFIVFKHRHAFIIPRRAVTAGDYEAFVAELNKSFAEASDHA